MWNRSRVWIALLLVAVAAGGGCAYFNLFYNAEKAFDEAEQAGEKVDPRNQPTSQQRQAYQKVIRKCRDLLDEYPESDLVDDALFLMGKSHLRLKEYSDAIRNFDNVLVNFPSSEFVEETMYLKSLAHLSRGEEQVGLEWFARLRESFPEGRFGAEALFRLGDAYADGGRPEQAMQYYRQFLERYPGRPERSRVQLALARVLVESDRAGEAVQTLDGFDAAKVGPEEAFEAQRLRVVALLDVDRSQDAVAMLPALDAAAGSAGRRDEAELLRGRVLLESGDYENGVAVLEQLAADRAGQPIGSEALGQVIEYAARVYGPDSEQLAASIAATEGVRLGGEWGQKVRLRNQQIETYMRLREQVEAADSTSAGAAFDLAELVLLAFDRPEEATQWYARVLELDPQSARAPRAAYALAWVQGELLGDEEASQATFARLSTEYPDSPQARALAGETFTEAKPRTREELELLAASGGTELSTGGGPGGVTGRPGDPRFAPSRSLRFGGPGATTPRERGTR